MAFDLSLFSAITVQKNTRDLRLTETNEDRTPDGRPES